MRRARFAADGRVRTGRIKDGRIVTGKKAFDADEVTLLPPCEPSKIIAVGKNYPDHIEEMAEKGFGDNEVPEFPFLFFKPPSSMIGHGADISYPNGAETVHYEGEVAVIVGERCHSVDPANALNKLEGYTALNDVSFRDWSPREDQWVRHKGLDTFCPIGPCVQTDIAPNVSLETRLNGETRQQGNTGDMAFSIADLVAEVSQYMTLEPGDVIATGTPSGVGAITPGDTVEVEVEGVGTLQNGVSE